MEELRTASGRRRAAEFLVAEIQSADPDYLPPGILDGIDLNIDQKPAFQAPDIGGLAFRAVERLLDEAGVLLGKCHSYRTAKLDLEVKAIELWIELQQFALEDKVKMEQINAGELELDSKIAAAQRTSLERSVASFSDSAAAQTLGAKHRTAGDPVYAERVTQTGIVTKLSAYNNFPELEEESKKLARNTLTYEKDNADAGKSSSEGTVENFKGLLQAAELRESFETKNAPLKFRLVEIRREMMKKKALLASRPGSGENYRERIVELQSLFDRDAAAAYGRCLALSRGMADVYGIDTRPPAPKSTGWFTEIMLWTRDCMEQIAQLADRQLEVEIGISVRRRVSDADWQKFLTGGEVTIDLDPKDFSEGYGPRIRGIGLHLVTPSHGSFDVSGNVPAAGIQYAATKNWAVDQLDVPTLRFGTARSRVQATDLSVLASRVLENVSPVGRWTLVFPQTSSLSEDRTTIDDIVLILRTAMLQAHVA